VLQLVRALVGVSTSLGVALFVSTCGGPEDLGPFALGLDEDGVVIVACDDLELSSVELHQSLVVNGEREYPEVIGEWGERQSLAPGERVSLDPVSPLSGFGGIQVLEANATYFVEGLQVDGQGATATFRMPAEGLLEGTWLGTDQSVNVTPCDYWQR
jgi:hypothetical protein